MRVETYSHNGGAEIVPATISKRLLEALRKINFRYRKNSAKELRGVILEELQAQGWSDETRLDLDRRITVTGMNGDIALCLQTGNMSRFYADLLKLQFLYIKERASSAIYLLPTKRVAQLMGSNMANFDRLTSELDLFSKIIFMPILVVGLD